MSIEISGTSRSSVVRQSGFGEAILKVIFFPTANVCLLSLLFSPSCFRSPRLSRCLLLKHLKHLRLPPPNRPQCVFIYAVFAHRAMASNPRRFSSPLQEQLVQHEAPIGSCPSFWWCHRDAIMYRSLWVCLFFFPYFFHPHGYEILFTALGAVVIRVWTKRQCSN